MRLSPHIQRVLLCLAITLAASGGGGEGEGAGAAEKSTAIPDLLLDPKKQQRPNDTSGKVDISFTNPDGSQPTAQTMKVVFGQAGASFGQSRPTIKDWSSYDRLNLLIMNPSKNVTKLTLTIKHAGSKGFGSRIDLPVTLMSGENLLLIDLAKLRNNDKSQPNLSQIRHWYIAAESAGTVLFVWNISLAKRPATTASGASPSQIISKAILFNTPEADRIVSAMQIFPKDNPWNEDISNRPIHPKSKQIVASMDANRHLYFNRDMGFVIVPAGQKRVPVKITGYPGESDPGPFPIPNNAPIEGWPINGGELANVQRKGQGDRHLIVVDPKANRLYEFFGARRTDSGWQAAQASVFDLGTNKLRPDGWTSSDAAGLAVFPAVVRFDECESGMVKHAMRVTARKTRKAYVYPATHYASRHRDVNLPRMGERLRLRANYDISSFSPHAQAVLKGLKKYGMIVADNGISWNLSVAPDRRIKGLEALNKVKGRDFEVIVPTGPNEGPRSSK